MASRSAHQQQRLVRTFCPVFRFHPTERWFPMSVTKYLETVDEREGVWHQTAPPAARVGSPDDQPVLFAFFGRRTDPVFVDIVYCLVFGYSGPIFWPSDRVGVHDFDVSRVVVRVELAPEGGGPPAVHSVYYSYHNGGRWVDAAAVELLHSCHPVAYVARYSHSMLPGPGTVHRFGSLANDVAADGGVELWGMHHCVHVPLEPSDADRTDPVIGWMYRDVRVFPRGQRPPAQRPGWVATAALQDRTDTGRKYQLPLLILVYLIVGATIGLVLMIASKL